MAYGLKDSLPEENHEVVRRMALRWLRAAGPHNEWAKTAKRCTDMVEGRHWTPEQKATMQAMNRSALTLNMVAPLFRLVMGYQSSNRLDTRFNATSDSISREDVATVLTNLHKAESGRMGLKYVDSEVFADGLVTGRGFWDFRLDFEKNDFGEIKAVCSDPYTKYIDPDASMYNLDDTAAYITDSVWTDIEAIRDLYGPAAAYAVENISATTYQSTLLSFAGADEISPIRFFGQYADDKAFQNWSDVYHTDFVDHQAKRVRILDSQYKISSIKPCFVDLETGTKEPIPDEWWMNKDQHWKIEQALQHAAKLGNHVQVAKRPVRRVRWTVSCGDILLHDGWSPYESYTTVGFFPYFRRGYARGMIEDLIDPSMEANKKRSIRVDIMNQNANSGWVYEVGTLDAEQERNLRKYGSSPGVHVKWKRNGPNAEAPRRLEPGNYPQGLDRLEEQAQLDLYKISGINESALGQIDKVQSGRAIEARQRQAVLSIQMYQDNFSRSKEGCGEKSLEIYQNHYTEQRVFSILGEDSKLAMYEINKKIMTGTNSIQRMNDITTGKYAVAIDEVPISATFKQGQFEEALLMVEKLGPVGMALAQTAPHLLVDMSSLPRKEEWKQALGVAMGVAAAAAPPPGGPAGAPPALPAPPPTPLGMAAATPEQYPS